MFVLSGVYPFITGYAGKFCEKLVSISLSNVKSYVAVDPISRGCFLPKGNLSITFSTAQTFGVIFYYSEIDPTTVKDSSSSERFLIAELYQGHVKLSFALGRQSVAVTFSTNKVC